MIPDIKLKEYYLRYVYNAKRDIEKYKELLNSIISTKQELYEVVNKYYDVTLEYEDIKCIHSHINMQCIKERCTFYNG